MQDIMRASKQQNTMLPTRTQTKIQHQGISTLKHMRSWIFQWWKSNETSWTFTLIHGYAINLDRPYWV